MSLPEMLLRLGTGLVAWLVIYTHLIWLGTLRIIGCNSDADELWRLLFGFAPIVFGFSWLLLNTKKLPEVHQIIRWFVLPLFLLVPLALIPIWQALSQTTLGGEAICSINPVPWWHKSWAPVQIVTVAWIVVMCWRAWRTAPLKPS
ncbi:MAG: hypothetical protein V2I41_16910 [Pseudomonadales bacterium]|jgi:hypothetical protein|nr:hypothetical protein [Pseudomonadales bacterium]